MNSKQAKRQHRRRKEHVERQNAKRREALDNATVIAGLHSDKTVYREMEDQGYRPTERGGWRRLAKIRRKQPRKDR